MRGHEQKEEESCMLRQAVLFDMSGALYGDTQPSALHQGAWPFKEIKTCIWFGGVESPPSEFQDLSPWQQAVLPPS